jgi:hypothetical protein
MTTTQFTTEQTEIRSDWQLAINADMVLQRQGAHPAKVRVRQPRLVALAERAIAEGKLWIRPQVAYQVLKIQEVKPSLVILTKGAQLKGSGIARKLAGADFLIMAVATIGPELEQQILRVTKREAAFAFALDGCGTAAVGALTIAVRRFFADHARGRQLTTTAPFYPGTNDWDLAAAQIQLFSIVDASAIGVGLNSSFLMTPCKSVSMVIGAGANMQSAAQPCEECGSSATCRHKLSES